MVGKTVSHLSHEISNSKSQSFFKKRDFVIFKHIINLLSHRVNKIIEKLPTPSERIPIAPGQVGEGGIPPSRDKLRPAGRTNFD